MERTMCLQGGTAHAPVEVQVATVTVQNPCTFSQFIHFKPGQCYNIHFNHYLFRPHDLFWSALECSCACKHSKLVFSHFHPDCNVHPPPVRTLLSTLACCRHYSQNRLRIVWDIPHRESVLWSLIWPWCGKVSLLRTRRGGGGHPAWSQLVGVCAACVVAGVFLFPQRDRLLLCRLLALPWVGWVVHFHHGPVDPAAQ